MKSRIQFAQVPAPPSPATSRFLSHPFFAWAGLRPPLAQHTLAEHEALMRHARNAQTVLEIGVAEGASAAALREAMHALSGSSPSATTLCDTGSCRSIFFS